MNIFKLIKLFEALNRINIQIYKMQCWRTWNHVCQLFVHIEIRISPPSLRSGSMIDTVLLRSIPASLCPPLFTTSACACTQVSMQTRYPVSLQTYTRVIDIIPSVPRNFQRSKKVLEKSELKSESMTVIFPYSPAFVGRWCCLICVATKWRVVDHALRILTHTHIYIDR